MVAGATWLLWLVSAANLATPDDLAAALRGLGDADLVLMGDPAGASPVRVLLASRVSAPVEKVRQVIADPTVYRKAMPEFRRVEVVSRREREPGVVDLEVAWELEVPLRNLAGKLRLRSRPSGVDLALSEGDFAPGIFHLSARGEQGAAKDRTILIVEGFANVRDVNWATRQIAKRSSIAEPAITVAAAYVLLKSLARLAEGALPARPVAAMTAPELSSLNGTAVAKAAGGFVRGREVVAAVRSRPDGRLARVEVAISVLAPEDQVIRRTKRPESFRALPGWKKITPVSGNSDQCSDIEVPCWQIKTNLPVFSLDGTWKIWPRPWRARMVAGDTRDAVMGIDVLPAKTAGRTTVVLSQHPRLDLSGFVARKLIAAEPFLEQGLALALTVVDAVALGSALEND